MSSSTDITFEHTPIKTSPYWWEAAPRPPVSDQTLPSAVEVAIIGAGYTGLNTALVLARAGIKVAVFDAGPLGAGASTLNGGMVGPSFHKLGVAGLKNKFGEDNANAILKESLGFVDFLEKFLKEEEIDAEFSRVGRFRGALKADHYEAMAKELDVLKHALDLNAEMVPPSDQAAETGSTLFKGGIVYHQDAGLHPGKYHDGLVQRVIEAGAKIYPETRVINFVKSGSKFILTNNLQGITSRNNRRYRCRMYKWLYRASNTQTPSPRSAATQCDDSNQTDTSRVDGQTDAETAPLR